MSNIDVKFDTVENILKRRGLNPHGEAQQYVDSEVMRNMEPYMQLDTGMMIKSMHTATDVGSGEVKVNTPYAKMRLHNGKTKGLRGPQYFERMKADHRDEILRGLEHITGGEAK